MKIIDWCIENESHVSFEKDMQLKISKIEALVGMHKYGDAVALAFEIEHQQKGRMYARWINTDMKVAVAKLWYEPGNGEFAILTGEMAAKLERTLVVWYFVLKGT